MASSRESDTDYHAVIAVLNDRWRVIDSCEPYPYRQWILQQRTGKNPIHWKGRAYYQSRDGLLRAVREKVERDIGADALALLGYLPARDLGKKPCP